MTRWRALLGGSALLVIVAAIALLLYPSAETLTAVAGEDEPPPPPMDPDAAQIERAALEEAAAYAETHGSRALLVGRRGHLVYQRYWQGSSFDTRIDAQSLALWLPRLLTGIALAERTIAYPEQPASHYLEQRRAGSRREITIRTLVHEPGTDAALALAAVLAAASQRPYAEYLSDKLWKRLGAADAALRLEADCCFTARQGDWIRVGEMLLASGVYQGTEVLPRGWAREALASALASRNAGYVARDVFVLGGADGHRLWIAPSLGVAILRIAGEGAARANWQDAHIPNLIVRGMRDFAPSRTSGSDVDPGLYVPGH